MKQHLKKELKDSIEYFLEFSDCEVMFPKIIIVDKTDKKTWSMALQFAINDSFEIEDPIIIANELSFTRKDHESVLCHELGHLISLSKNSRTPSNFFFKLLRDEIYADREGFILYFHARRKKWGYATLFTENFRDLIFDIKQEKDRRILYKRYKSLVINAIRLFVFVGFLVPMERRKL